MGITLIGECVAPAVGNLCLMERIAVLTVVEPFPVTRPLLGRARSPVGGAYSSVLRIWYSRRSLSTQCNRQASLRATATMAMRAALSLAWLAFTR